MSVDFLFEYSALELFWLLMPVLVAISVVEVLAIYFFKAKGKNDFKEWLLNLSMGILSYPINGIFAFMDASMCTLKLAICFSFSLLL